LSVVRPMSGLLTTLIVSLLWYVKVDTLETLCKENLDWAYNPFKHFYLNYYTKFLYSLFNTLFLIHSHKLFSMQLGPSIAFLACARLIVPFSPFIATLELNIHFLSTICHNLAKRLSHFLFLFCFVLFYLVRSLLR